MSVNYLGTLTLTFGATRITSPAYQKWSTWNFFILSIIIKFKYYSDLTYLKFENRLRKFLPQKSSNHSLYLIKLFIKNSSYPEGNFGGNQLLDSSISLSPLYSHLTINLHVRTATSLHQTFA